MATLPAAVWLLLVPGASHQHWEEREASVITDPLPDGSRYIVVRTVGLRADGSVAWSLRPIPARLPESEQGAALPIGDVWAAGTDSALGPLLGLCAIGPEHVTTPRWAFFSVPAEGGEGRTVYPPRLLWGVLQRPVLLDFDGDGHLEIAAGSSRLFGGGLMALRLDGEVLWQQEVRALGRCEDMLATERDVEGRQRLAVLWVDPDRRARLRLLDGEGHVIREIPFGRPEEDLAGKLSMFDSSHFLVHAGTLVFGVDVEQERVWSHTALDHLILVRGPSGRRVALRGYDSLCVLDGDGTILWERQPDEFMSFTSHAGVDLDGDGADEILVNEYRPPGCYGQSPENQPPLNRLLALNGDGSVLWTQPPPPRRTQDVTWASHGVLLGPAVDLPGDGLNAVLVRCFGRLALLDSRGETLWERDAGHGFLQVTPPLQQGAAPSIVFCEPADRGRNTGAVVSLLDLQGELLWRRLVLPP